MIPWEFNDCPISKVLPFFDEEKEELTLFAVNRDLEEPLLMETDLRDFPDYHVTEHIVLESANAESVNTIDNPNNVVPHIGGKTVIEDGMAKSVLNKLSWNVIRLGKK